MLDILHGQLAENRGHIAARFRKPPDVVVVSAAMREGLFEDRRIGRHALEAVLRNHPLEFVAREEFAAQEIEPDGLTEFLKLLQPVHALTFATWSRAASSTASAVIPKCL